jgi:hypothetical protein
MEVVSSCAGLVLAYVVRRESEFEETAFVSPPDAPLQLGFVVYGAGKSIARHVHVPVERRITGTSEFLWVRQGRCEVDLYDEARCLVATRELRVGDAILLMAGGHAFRMLEDTVLAEVKQGPYLGLEEKERF